MHATKGPKRDMGPCLIPWCKKAACAKGYCMRHYGILWKARLLPFQRPAVSDLQRQAEVRRVESRQPVKPTSEMHAHDRYVALLVELKWARMAYPVVCGWEKRLEWRRRIERIEEALAALDAKQAVVTA